MLSRRSFFTGLVVALAAPAVIKSGILMPVKSVILPPPSRIALNHPIQEMNSVIFQISHNNGYTWESLGECISEDIKLRMARKSSVIRSFIQQRIGDQHEQA